jgi:lincosamide nucleotidyltransferase A/C/D/E
MMTAEDVIGLYRLLDAAGIDAWVDGGWCVDALVGRQLRDHDDLDLAVDGRHDAEFRRMATAAGFDVARVEGPFNLVWADADGRRLDIHTFIRDGAGRVVGGILYPTASLTGTGTIRGVAVRCIAPRHMVEFLAPHVQAHAWKYAPAIDALCETFGLERPADWVAARAAMRDHPGERQLGAASRPRAASDTAL